MRLIKRTTTINCKCNDCEKTIKANIDTKFDIVTNTKELTLCDKCFNNFKTLIVLFNDVDNPIDGIYEI